MTKSIGVMVALLLALALSAACAQSQPSPLLPEQGDTPAQAPHEEDGAPSPTLPEGDGMPPSYTGFMAPAEGQWVEYVISADGAESRQTMEYIGQDTVDGKVCTGFEMTMTVPGQGDSIAQMWVEAATKQAVKYVIKIGDQVICMSLSQSPYESPEVETPAEYDPSSPDISYGTYTTPTGKTVNVGKFEVSGGEVWASSQVPFGMVKSIDGSGETAMYLYDFGISGAHRDISRAEMENCMQMPG